MRNNYAGQRLRIQWLIDAIKIKTTACMEWPYAKSNGYGQVYFDGRVEFVHRAVMFLTDPTFCEKDWALHRCDNPPCFNPAHIFKGTSDDNIRDMHSKGRGAYGEKNCASKLKASQVREIRSLASAGENQAHIASMFGINKSTVSRIVAGLRWRRLA